MSHHRMDINVLLFLGESTAPPPPPVTDLWIDSNSDDFTDNNTNNIVLTIP